MQIVCLANSWKEGGRCIAGIDTTRGRWIRPVSQLKGGALSVSQCSAIDGAVSRQVQPLDIVDIGTSTPAPELGQPENHALGPTSWRVAGWATAGSLLKFAVDEPQLLYGTTDRVADADVRHVRNSLALVHIDTPEFEVRARDNRAPQLRVHINHHGVDYDLSVTDGQDWVRAARFDPDRYSQGKWLFTISLGGSFHGYRYKLAACGLEL
jgi:hypothetical protein